MAKVPLNVLLAKAMDESTLLSDHHILARTVKVLAWSSAVFARAKAMFRYGNIWYCT